MPITANYPYVKSGVTAKPCESGHSRIIILIIILDKIAIKKTIRVENRKLSYMKIL